MGFSYKMSGLAELREKLDALPTKLAKRVIRPALQSGAEIIQQEAGVRAPRKSGTLTTHIGIDLIVHNDLTAEAHVGPTDAAFWGKFSELGTAPHEESSPKGTKPYMHPGEPARPWLRPAFSARGQEAVQAMADEIRDGLKDVT
jgi:HK97 gp10 family phage protein